MAPDKGAQNPEHKNAVLLRRLFTSLQARDHSEMADCYAPAATFRDIAFDLHDRSEIHAMWRMVCTTTTVTVTIESIEADDHAGRARIVDDYTFSDTQRRVVNPIESRFRFENGRIVEHRDECDARRWADQAFGGVKGWLAGRIRLLARVRRRANCSRIFRTPNG
jgi:ketosteroid isomerase-like protein